MTDQDRHDGRHGFDWDEGVVLETAEETHADEEDAERARQHQEALQEEAIQAARDAVDDKVNSKSQSGVSD